MNCLGLLGKPLECTNQNSEEAFIFLMYKILPSNFEKTTVFSNVCFPAWV